MSLQIPLTPFRLWQGCLAIVMTAGVCAQDVKPAKQLIAGTVVNTEGKPVAGADVICKTRESEIKGKSGADGSFSIAPPSPNLAFGSVLNARGADDTISNFISLYSLASDPNKPLKLVLKPKRKLEVLVVDDGGKPIPGASVHFGSHWVEFGAGRTDENGVWKFDIPADPFAWKVLAFKSNLGLDYAQSANSMAVDKSSRDLASRITLKLDGAMPPLKVKTVDSQGKPVAGIEVAPWLIQRPGQQEQLNGTLKAHAVTNDRGEATLDWLPQKSGTDRPNVFQILAYGTGYVVLDHSTVAPDTTKTPDAVLTITMHRPVQLAGRVTGSDGRPISGAKVSAHGAGSMNGFARESSTDADGRYSFEAYPDHIYIIRATKNELVSPITSGIILREGAPVTNADFVLGAAVKLHGKVTYGKGKKPLQDFQVTARFSKGQIPDELKKPGNRFYLEQYIDVSQMTDKDGEYTLFLGPEAYEVFSFSISDRKPTPLKLTANDLGKEQIKDFDLPRALKLPLVVRVIDEAGKPVANATLEGAYRSNGSYFRAVKADPEGVFRGDRVSDPLELAAFSSDRSLAGIVRIDEDTTETRVVVKPAANAKGRLVDQAGAPIVDRDFECGILVYSGPTKMSPFSYQFGARTKTDKDGRFAIPGMIVGEEYHLHIYVDQYLRSPQNPIKPTASGDLNLGDLVIDLTPPKPYTPPTAADRAATSFAARKEMSTKEKIAYTLVEAKREYTRPLVLLGNPKNAETIDMFRLFDAVSEQSQADDKKTAGDLRWEFELASFDITKPDVLAWVKDAGISMADNHPSRLFVLNDDGKVAATIDLKLDAKKELDANAIAKFLRQHKPPTRDAERMLSDGLDVAKHDKKRVFLIMSASWCGPCRMLARFLAANKSDFSPHYVFVKLDMSRDTHAEDLRTRFQGKDAANGVPWYVILDENGKPLATSNAKDQVYDGVESTNIGFPNEAKGIDHFIGMIKETAKEMKPETLQKIRTALEKKS